MKKKFYPRARKPPMAKKDIYGNLSTSEEGIESLYEETRGVYCSMAFDSFPPPPHFTFEFSSLDFLKFKLHIEGLLPFSCPFPHFSC